MWVISKACKHPGAMVLDLGEEGGASMEPNACTGAFTASWGAGGAGDNKDQVSGVKWSPCKVHASRKGITGTVGESLSAREVESEERRLRKQQGSRRLHVGNVLAAGQSCGGNICGMDGSWTVNNNKSIQSPPANSVSPARAYN